MDQSEHYQNLHSWTQFLNKKLATQLLLSLSFLSFFFFFSSPCYSRSFFLHYFNLYVSEFPFQLLNHSMDRNYIFLICNGILVLLAKTSDFNIHSPSVDSDLNDQLVPINSIGDSLQSSSESTKESALMIEKEQVLLVETSTGLTDLETVVMEKDEEREDDQHLIAGDQSENYSNFVLEDEEQEVKTVILQSTKGGGGEKQESGAEEEEEEEEEEDDDIEKGSIGFIIEEEEEDYIEKGSIGFIIEEEDEEDGNDDELLNTEELNKKFDDFIRRVKKEIRTEAHQQLVIV